VAVNEADIGKIHPGQPVQFTVDAFPGDTFTGEVGKIRLNASMTQNVVIFTVEVITNNADGHLLPYLTANLKFELNRLSDVLLVPNAALRWMPSVEQVFPEWREAFKNPVTGEQRRQGVQMPRSKPVPSPDDGKSQGVLWVLHGQQVRPVQVRMGLSDGAKTEVEGEGLAEGLAVVTGMQMQARRQVDASNPFTPQFLRRSRSPATR
jgi:HlyD family secretion protein